jgi:hypothetical protein
MKILVNALVFFSCLITTVQAKTHRTAEQTSFGLGDLGPVIQHPVQISDPELAALAEDDVMLRELDREPPIGKLTREGLEAGVVHLHGPHERDLIVVGSGAPFIGANVGPFWIVRDLPDGPQVVFSTIALGISIQSTWFNQYRTIEASAATAVEVTTVRFRFDGKKYVVYKTSVEEMKK